MKIAIRSVGDFSHAAQLTILLNKIDPDWHPLIESSFKNLPPHTPARFRPDYGKNVFYGSEFEITALYETAYNIMKIRRNEMIESETGTRTLLFVEANNNSQFDVTNEINLNDLMHKNDYSASHVFVRTNPDIKYIRYPSVRDPALRYNAAILDINLISKEPHDIKKINFIYDTLNQNVFWLEFNLQINWREVT